MFSSHGLAIERLRWKERYRAPVPREWRLCRICRSQVEDEVHALLECRGDHLYQLEPLRDAMRMEVSAIAPDFLWHPDSHTQLLQLLHDRRLPIPIAKFIFQVLTLFYSVPMYIPAPYLYSPVLLTQP
jgi:hypothetical protein